MATIRHAKTNNITDWSEEELARQIAAGNFPAGTTLSDIVLPSDWNDDHQITDFQIADVTGLQTALDAKANIATQTSHATDLTLNSSDSGKIFTNRGATGTVIFTLPTAAAGFSATFIVAVDSYDLRVQAASGDYIRDASLLSSVAGYIKSNKIGAVLDLYCIDDTYYFVRSAKGSWTIA